MGANIAGIYGAQIFREDDSPRYRRGFTVDIAIVAFGLGLAIIRFVDDKLWQRRQANRLDNEALGSQDENDETEESNRSPQRSRTPEKTG